MNKGDLLRCLRKGARFVAIALLMVGLSAGGWALYLQLVGNIHAVAHGVVYRSTQLNGERLTSTLKKHQIKSVINLRGDSDEGWYSDELKITAAQGARHCDLGTLLIHCNSGSDRTGLVAAVYTRFIEGHSAEEAAQQLVSHSSRPKKEL